LLSLQQGILDKEGVLSCLELKKDTLDVKMKEDKAATGICFQQLKLRFPVVSLTVSLYCKSKGPSSLITPDGYCRVACYLALEHS